MAATTTTNLSSAQKTEWKLGVLDLAKNRTLMDRFGDTDAIDSGNNTVYWQRIQKPALVTTTATPGTLIAGSSANNLVSYRISATPVMMQNYFGFDEDVEWTQIIKNEEFKSEIADNMAQSHDKYAYAQIATQCMRHRVDNSSDYQKAFTCTGVGTTTTVVSTTLNQGADYWGGSASSVGYVTFTSPYGVNYDSTFQVTDDNGSGTLTVGTMPQACTTTSKGRVVIGTGLTAANVMTSTALADVACLHEVVRTPLFDGQTIVGFIHPLQHRDLLNDSIWLARAEYSQPSDLSNYKFARFFGNELYIGDNVHREGANGVASDSGAVFVSLFFGKNPYGLLPWGGHGTGRYGADFYFVDTPDSGNLTLAEKYISWKSFFAVKVKYSTRIIGLMSGATSMEITV